MHIWVVIFIVAFFLQRVSHSSSVMYAIFYVTSWDPSWRGYFWLGCVLMGGESRTTHGYDETAWVELAAHVKPGRMERVRESCETYDKAWERSGWENGLACCAAQCDVSDFKYCRMSSAAPPTCILLSRALQRRKRSCVRWNFQLCRTVKVSVKWKKNPAPDLHQDMWYW